MWPGITITPVTELASDPRNGELYLSGTYTAHGIGNFDNLGFYAIASGPSNGFGFPNVDGNAVILVLADGRLVKASRMYVTQTLLGSVPAAAHTEITFSPNSDSILYIAVPSHGLYLSMDGGMTSSLVRAAAGSCHLQADSGAFSTLYFANGDAIEVSTDGGTTWTATLTGSAPVAGLAADPKHAGTVYASVSSSTGSPEVVRSTDSGTTWTPVLTLQGTGTVVVSSDGTHVYANDPVAHRLFISSDGGSTFPAQQAVSRSVITVHPILPDTLAGIDPSNGHLLATYESSSWMDEIHDGGCSIILRDPSQLDRLMVGSDILYSSRDGAQSWQPVHFPDGFMPGSIAVASNGVLMAVDSSGALFKSTDWGLTWSLLSGAPPSVMTVTPDLSKPGVWVARLVGNTALTQDDGASWSQMNSPVTHPAVYDFKISPSSSVYYELIGSVTTETLYSSTDQGATWNTEAGGFSANTIVVDPLASNALFLYGGAGLFHSTDYGHTLGSPMPLPIAKLEIDPSSGTIFAATGAAILRSDDGGQTFVTQDSPSNVQSLAIEPRVPGTVYACNYGGVWKTTTGGR
jgi:photosystem II stability/assembly factor-like uncharacterized protein